MGSNTRLSGASVEILCALGGGEQHGYAIMQLIRHASDGRRRIGPGTLYRNLQALAEAGLITEIKRAPESAGEERRRYYRLTAAGRRVMVDELRRMNSLIALSMAARTRTLASSS